MSKKYKLTTQDLKTRKGEYNETQWEVGVWSPELNGKGDLCGEGWYHYYHDPLLAAFMNPEHANIENPICWEISAQGRHLDDNGIKGGCTKIKLVKEVYLPIVSKTQRIAFSILCAKEVFSDKKWNKWADGWLSGRDRSSFSAAAAYYAASASAVAAASAAASAAANWNFEKLLSIAQEAVKY